MKYMRQFGIILGVTCAGELMKYFIPLPIPGSIYGLLLMFVLLLTKVIKVENVKDVGEFLIEIMPLMFIPAGVGLMASWGELQGFLVPLLVITVSTTFIVIFVTGKVTDFMMDRKEKTSRKNRKVREERKKMENIVLNSATLGFVISLLAYEIGLAIKKKWKLAILNPLLISILLVIGVLILFGVDYDSYNASAQYLSYLLTPATVCLAIPLYIQLDVLKKNVVAIMVGILSGVAASMGSILAMAMAFGLSHKEYVTLLPKSITTAIGMGVSEELGGYVTISVATIIITGVLGNIFAESVCKLFRIRHAVSRGLAIGTAAHAVGTAKAMEMGEVEGAMSSLAIVVCGLCTVVGASVFAGLL